MRHNIDTGDELAIGLGGALILVGTVVLGTVEILAGPPYGAAPVTNDAGEVVATPMVDPTLRTGLVIAGLVVLFLWGLYKMALPETEGDAVQRGTLAGE